ncbi:homing endonuclease HNH [Shewanella sp. phage 1/40]|uniref:homing endonuclease HNH n=1 Tax=Shewanella sp. phage 1/40 TaxID=1458860 RepID=UPI0004F75D1E|nr:homing endonuclease HNH [Shewanella sp. phage 1/40]AHK11411.1 homing endonuclease HNH [Shewanella sp. phage 1/40]
MTNGKYVPEVWKTLVHYDRKTWTPLDFGGRYTISNYGRVKDAGGIFIKPQLTGKPPYFYVNVRLECGSRKLIRVHLAMMYTFNGLPINLKYTCDHIDQNSYNNNLWNLRWASRKQQMNNRSVTVMVGGTPLTDLTHIDGYTSKEADYIRSRLSTGASYEESVISLSKYQQRGGHYPKRVTVDGVDTDLWDWCNDLSLNYKTCIYLLNLGWSLFQIQYNIPPINMNYVFEFEGICFPSRRLLLSYLGVGKDKYLDLCREGLSLSDIKQNRQEYADRYKFEFQGFFMTKEGHCDRLGTSTQRVDTLISRHNMSIEDALLQEPKQIIKHSINGEVKRNSDWARHFDIPSRRFNGYMSRHKCFKKSLEHFGIDTSNMEITPFF